MGGDVYARAVVFSIAVCFCACTRPPSPIPHEQPPHPPAPRPASCQQIASGTQLQALLDAAPDAAAFCLAPGRYSGPIRISRGQSIWGPRSAVVATSGEGTTVRIHGKNSRLSGITVSGSGPRFDKLDAGVQIEGEDIEIDDVKVEGATFGILVDKSKRTTVSRCDIRGRTDLPFGLRGDGIRFWEAQDSVLRGNFVRDARDLVTRYSQRITIEDNVLYDNEHASLYLNATTFPLVQRNIVFCTDDPRFWRKGSGTDYHPGPGIQIRDEDFEGQEVMPPPSSDQVIVNNLAVGCSTNFGVATQRANGQGGLDNALVAHNVISE